MMSASSLLSLSRRRLTEGGGQANHLGRALEPSAAHSCSLAVHSRPPSMPRVSSTVCIVGLATTDLWAELERRCSGEDGHITIERQWERRCCQGRNHDGDFDAMDTAPVGQTAHTPMPLVESGGGCMALGPHIRMVV
jgi:hypothetical protein